MDNRETVYPLRYRSYRLDFFRPGDAEGIAALFGKVYGQGYPVRTYYDPAAICRQNENGGLISVVARTLEGRVVAHVGLYRSAPNPALYESGVGLVDPAHRKAGLVSELMRLAHRDAPRRFSIDGIWGEAVTNHTYVQQAARRLGTVFTALEVDLMPVEAYEEEKSAGGRVASLTGFVKIRPLPPMPLFVPESLLPTIRFFYSGLDLERRFLPGPPEADPGTEASLQTQYHEFARVVRTTVGKAGPGFASRVREIEALYDPKARVHQFWVDLSHPGAPRAILTLADSGFFLGGVVPLWNGGDGFLMQKTLRAPDWGGIRISDEKGREILDRTRRDWQRAAGL